ncbi:MAG: DUF167 domain-containing protein [Actinomycetota bacterium]|nr:DUF167 domain-containing protein [Actinomycetota bacterium]
MKQKKVQIEIKVIPGAKKQEVKNLDDGTYCVKLKNAPEKGKANEELISIIASYFDVDKKSVSIVKGMRGRRKVLEIIS